ncbi:solute carrier family 40 (iron-regulated transporter) protein [Diplodia corticola]|uniref:Solute carrier family 40 (Iron-regulated transporter) protein n=1 Tax=Diplodia corticola TaxID=236234 RepID=A0A1J9S391_9PEZI|nr:solute carrier family 40 (iron-regulated transporter) protein [Diplodia corticola]OJD34468.1 solute carrier family 40 (iron-regulated transporter) protein [Diplodia corticola]
MRLRLSIRRHNLPTAELLWAVPDDRANDAFTVAQLLEHVNDIIPLESLHWGLEDYTVEIASYEALHFQNVRDIFKDEDQVCIRHLTQPELRARHIAGRDQINANGQHLVDGIPFGKSYFSARKPGRPPVNIPPLKNPIADSTDGDEVHGLLDDVPQFQHHIDDDEDDEDFVAEQPAPKRRRLESVRSDKSDKSVHFQDDDALVALPSDDDTEEEYRGPLSISDSSSDVSTRAEPIHVDTKVVDTAATDDSGPSSSDSDSSSDDSDSSSVDPSSDIASSEHSSSDDSSSDDTSDSDSSSTDEDDSDSGSEPDEASSKPLPIVVQPSTGQQNASPIPTRVPFQGLKRTKARNRRRRIGKLHKRDTPHEAGRWMGTPPNVQGTSIVTSPSRLAEKDAETDLLEKKKAQLLMMLNSSFDVSNSKKGPTDVDSTPTDASAGEKESFDADIEKDSTNRAGESGLGNEVQKPASELTPESPTETTREAKNEVTDAPAPKRKRIDVDSFRRLTMGSLGLRNPKTKEDEQKLRDKIAATVSRRGKKRFYGESSAQEVEEEPEDLQDPDSWKFRIELMAFEVSDGNVQELSAPPFPFKQRWDPQQWYEQYVEYDQEHEHKKKNKKKRKKNNQTYNEPEQHYQRDGNEDWSILDYDEPAEADAAQSQLLQETQDAQGVSEASLKPKNADEQMNASDDLPPLPPDVTALQTLVPEDIRVGSIVVYKEMEVSELTGWQPIISDYRRAEVLETEEDAAYLQLAAPDVPRSRSEARSGGKNGKLEAKTFDVTKDEEDDPSRRWVEFPNMAGLWLLQAAAPSDEIDGLADTKMADGNGEELTANAEEENVDEGTTEAHSPDEKGEDAVAEN